VCGELTCHPREGRDHLLRRDNAAARAQAAGLRQHRLGRNRFQLGGSFVFGPGNVDRVAHVSETFGTTRRRRPCWPCCGAEVAGITAKTCAIALLAFLGGLYTRLSPASGRSPTGEPASLGRDVLLPWGSPFLNDVPVPGDYDGDGKADIAVYRLATGEWFLRRSIDGGLVQLPWGSPFLADVPVGADYDGDGKTDVAVYRTSTGVWFIRRSTDGGLVQIPWGSPFLADIPGQQDYDGDGRADIAVYRTSTGEWFIRRSTDASLTQIGWGAPSLGDAPVMNP